MFRKFSLIAVIMVMALIFAGCGLNKKIKDSVTEGIIDEINKAADEAEKVSKDDNDTEASEATDAADSEDSDVQAEDASDDSEAAAEDDASSEDNEDASADESTSSDSDDGSLFNGSGVINMDEGTITYDEDSYTFEGENGETMTISEDNEWPQGQAADLIPKLNKGTITYTMNLNTGCMLIINEITMDDYKAYLQQVKDAGFTVDPYEANSDDSASYYAYSEDKTYFSLIYSASDSSLSITLSVDESANGGD